MLFIDNRIHPVFVQRLQGRRIDLQHTVWRLAPQVMLEQELSPILTPIFGASSPSTSLLPSSSPRAGQAASELSPGGERALLFTSCFL